MNIKQSHSDLGIAMLVSSGGQRVSISRALTQLGFHVHQCEGGDELFDLVGEGAYRLVLLDFAWRDQVDALSVAARLRAASSVGLVMLTGAAPAERVRSLQCGADACIGAPQDIEEIAAQLLALARRMGQPAFAREAAADDPDTPSTWQLVNHGWTLITPSARTLNLTSAERQLFRTLAATPDHMVGRREWVEEDVNGRSSRWLDVMVSRLRRKALSQNIHLPIRVVRGKGYVFAESLVCV